jgi:predicted nucleotidyltransferase
MSFPKEDLAIDVQTWKLGELLKWREYLGVLVEAVRAVSGEGAEVYVFGSAVEGRLTVNSDVDVAVVLRELPKTSREKSRLLSRL